MSDIALYPLYHLIDPITGRRPLEEKYIYVGNSNNIEEPVLFSDLLSNVRDLRDKLALLALKFDYIANSRLLIPEKNKYLHNAQALNELSNTLLRHVNGVVKEAISGIHYTDVQNFPEEEGKICIIKSTANEIQNKFIRPADIDIGTIKTTIKITYETKNIINQTIQEINNITQTVTNNVQNIHNITQNIQNITNNVQNVIKNITDIYNNIENINNTINYLTQETKNIYQNIQNITESINYVTNKYNTEITNINNEIININQQEIINITEVTNNFNKKIEEINNHYSAEINNITNNIQNISNTIQNITNSISEITNHYNNENIEINNKIDLINKTLVDLQIDARIANILEAIGLINAQIVNIIARIEALENGGSSNGTCIAWAMGNDLLQIEWE